MSFQQYNARKNTTHRFRYSSLSSKNAKYNISSSLDNNSLSRYHIYEQKLLSFLEGIKANKIKYNSLKILFEYEDNFRLVCDIYHKYLKSKVEYEILNFYLKSLGNFISLIHSDEPMEALDKTLNTVNKYLRVRKYHKNSILFRIGDIGTKYYILLKGKAYTLVPKKYTKSMTFDQYRNHLKILYVFGEDYLLEQTMHCNIQSCDIAFSDIETDENKILRNLYSNNYTCNYNRYIKLINGDEHIIVENFDLTNPSEEEDDENNEEEINFVEENKNNNDENNEEEKENSEDKEIEEDKDDKDNEKENEEESNKEIKKLKIITTSKEKERKIFKYFNQYFGFKKNRHNNNSQLKITSHPNFKEATETINSNIQNENLFIKRDNRNISRIHRKIETIRLKDFDEVNSFNIGIPKELLTKEKFHNSKNTYDGGELPTFFTRNKNNYIFFDIDKEIEEENKKEEKENHKNLMNNYKMYNRYAKAVNAKRNLIIVGYENVATLSNGMSFGEISLLNENHKRSSTIFIDEDSQIGRLNIGEYNCTIKTVRTKIRTDSINFLLSTKLFGEISYSYFLNKYWIYFQCKKIQKGEFLFKIGEECETLYIIYNGEIKLSAYIDKDNINELIKGIKHEKAKKINYYLNKTQNLKNNNSSIFERKQKFCLMIGKKGDILGLSDIINFRNNKYICEAEVMTDNVSYYEIHKSLIFNKISHDIKKSIKNTLNVENLNNLIKLKQEFMIDKLKNIKSTIEYRYKYLNLDEIKNVPDNNNNLDSINNTRLNKNQKSLSLNSISVDNEYQNKNVCCNHNEKQILSTSFLKMEKIKEGINNIISNHQTFNLSKLSENNNTNSSKGNKLLSLNINRVNINNSLTLNQLNFNKTTDNSPKKNKINAKPNLNLKNTMNINSNLTLDMSNLAKTCINKNISIKNDSNKNNMNNSINNTNENESNINSTKLKNFNLCKPYEFPNIHNESNNIGNWEAFRKNKILKFLFLNEPNNERLKLFKYYKIKKSNIKDNYFINTLKSNNIKNNSKIIDNEDIGNNSSMKKNKYKYIIAKNIHSEKRNMKFKNDQKILKPLKLTIKSGKDNCNNNKSEKVMDLFNSNNNKIRILNKKNFVINNILINKKIKMSLSTEKNGNNSPLINKYQKNSLLKNFYYSLNKNNNNLSNKKKVANTLLPYIDRPKLK